MYVFVHVKLFEIDAHRPLDAHLCSAPVNLSILAGTADTAGANQMEPNPDHYFGTRFKGWRDASGLRAPCSKDASGGTLATSFTVRVAKGRSQRVQGVVMSGIIAEPITRIRPRVADSPLDRR